MSESGSNSTSDSAKKYPTLTFNRNTDDHAKLSELFETSSINIDSPLSLKNKWVIWEQIVKIGDRGHNNDYKEFTEPLVSFDSVQAFWNLWFNIPQPSELSTNKRIARECSDGSEHFVDAIMMFKDGIQPMWEDPLNKDGGHFDYRFRPSDVQQLFVDEYWNNIVLGLVGSTIPLGNLINGVRLVDKLNSRYPAVRIEVWFQNLGEANDATQLMKSIGTCMAKKLVSYVTERTETCHCALTLPSNSISYTMWNLHFLHLEDSNSHREAKGCSEVWTVYNGYPSPSSLLSIIGWFFRDFAQGRFKMALALKV